VTSGTYCGVSDCFLAREGIRPASIRFDSGLWKATAQFLSRQALQKRMRPLTAISVLILTVTPHAQAWNPPTHIVTGSIAYHTLSQHAEQRTILEAIRPFLYAKSLDPDGSLRRQAQHLTGREADEMRFILTAAWADVIRNVDAVHRRDKWHYINWPFKPGGEPPSVVVRPPQAENILSALAQNESVLRNAGLSDRRAIAFAWLLHLVGDLHQPLHAAQLFTRQYPEGDRGGNEICVRVNPGSAPINLHMLWDGWITSSGDTRMLTNLAADLRRKFPKARLTELSSGEPKAWAMESYELAKKTVYANGSLPGTPKGRARDCSEITSAKILPAGYAAHARNIAERRAALAGYRLANLLAKVCRQSNCSESRAASERR
jgi:S1/P1 nuclease